MAGKADGEAWPGLEKLSLDDTMRSSNGKEPAGDPADSSGKDKATDIPRNEAVEEGTIDIAIRQALMDPKERTTVLKIEEQVERFIQDTNREELEFPNNFSNYQRMLAHRVSQYYGLQTSVKDGFQEGPGRVVAKKTEHMRMPQTKLVDLKPALHNRSVDRGNGPKVLQRRPVQEGNKPAAPNAATAPSPALSMKAREDEYNEARERIGLGKPEDSSSSSSSTGKVKAQGSKGNGTVRAPANNTARGAPSRKAVIRDKEKEMQDPDYKRGPNRFTPRFDSFPHAQGPTMYGMPGFVGEVPMPKGPASPSNNANSHGFHPQWAPGNPSFRPPPPPPPPQPSSGPKSFMPGNGAHPVPGMARPMMYAPYPSMPGMHFAPGMAAPTPGVPPQGMYSHPNMHMAYPMMPGYTFVPPGQDGMHMPSMHMYPGMHPAAFPGFAPGMHPSMPRGPMPMGMHMMMGMPAGHFHMDLAHGMSSSYSNERGERGNGNHYRQHSSAGNSSSSATQALQTDDANRKKSSSGTS